jgi:hypothetical protein
MIPDSIVVQEALNNHQPVTLYSKRSTPASAYRALCREVLAQEETQGATMSKHVAS